MANPLDSLSSGLIGIIGEYFAGVRPSAKGSSDGLGGDQQAGLIVIYAGSGMPMGIGTMKNRREVARLAAAVPGTQIRTVAVGDETLAEHLCRLIGELFGRSLPFGIIGPESPAAPSAAGEVAAPKRRGRKPGSKNKVQGKRRGRPPGSGKKAAAPVAAVEAPRKRRGRPPGSGKKAAAPVAAAEAPRKRRGRPPGSGKKAAAPVAAVGAPRKRRGRRPKAQSVDAAGVPVVKRGPGRPRKNPIVAVAPKRRGRPPGRRLAS